MPETSADEPLGDVHCRATAARAWPFAEARALLKRIGSAKPAKGYVLFETGYGPSGLPHIGTFGEVVRTTMVRDAFALLSDVPTRLHAVSDDMDGLRKVPDNVPNADMIAPHLGKPLTSIPDPFGTHESFGAHNNARLRAFLDRFGFDYTFVSATECYRAGRFDATLRTVLERYDEVMNIMLPTLGPERRKTYSPFLPVCAETGRVLQVPIVDRDVDAGTVIYEREDGRRVETPVTGGHCKLQWKVDWAMRWVAFDVDYEMSGKDLIDSVTQSSKIARVLGGRPPQTITYELFLDENGEKISKSRGNGLTVDEWLTYAPAESLALFMYQKPKAAKKLHFQVIPKTVDDYLALLDRYATEDAGQKLENPVWHIHRGRPPNYRHSAGFGLLLNLVSVCHTEDKSVIWHFLSRYRPSLTPQSDPVLDGLVDHAIRYYRDFVKPEQVYRAPTAAERPALRDLADTLGRMASDSDADTIQTEVFEVGKRHEPFKNDLRSWFRTLYETLLGQPEGPRMGSFIALYGIAETISLIEEALAREADAAVAQAR